MLEQIKQTRTLSFLYNGEPFEKAILSERKTEENAVQTTVYTLTDGLVVTVTLRNIPGFDAVEIVNSFENTGSQQTGILSELWDCSVRLPMEHEEPYHWSAYIPDAENATKVIAPKGSNWVFDEFSCNPDVYRDNRCQNHIYQGESKHFANHGGRSSDGQAPFFNIHKNGTGYIYAVGWTGQWNFEVQREADSVCLRSKIEDTHFRLYPGERFRTSSAVIMYYNGDCIDAQNQWRRLVKEHFSLIGSEGRDSHGPLCAGIWGGMASEEAIRRVNVIRDNKLPFEYIWMDAGWYGANTKPTPDEFEGDWGSHTGDWVVSPLVHPDGLKAFSKTLHEAGMKLILWFEPERVVSGTPITKEHPEYFLGDGNSNPWNNLLNLGNEQAWNYIYETLSALIEEIGIDCYRQDFNFE
ncbi:MAG: alpha-galactosidase, partial [Eubacteriales bacterium]